MIERLEGLLITVLEPVNKEVLAEKLALELGVPKDRVPNWLSALQKALGPGDQTQRVIDYLVYKVETKKGDQNTRNEVIKL